MLSPLVCRQPTATLPKAARLRTEHSSTATSKQGHYMLSCLSARSPLLWRKPLSRLIADESRLSPFTWRTSYVHKLSTHLTKGLQSPCHQRPINRVLSYLFASQALTVRCDWRPSPAATAAGVASQQHYRMVILAKYYHGRSLCRMMRLVNRSRPNGAISHQFPDRCDR